MTGAERNDDFWVFAYGSLIWNPGFEFLSREPARLTGYHRRYCIQSTIYRGTPEAPGLVLGLEAGGSCEGVGYRVAGDLRDLTLEYLRARELITNVYVETLVSIETRDGFLHQAVTYVANSAHADYARKYDDDEMLAIVGTACGASGLNRDYAINTWSHLATLGVHDPLVERVAAALISTKP